MVKSTKNEIDGTKSEPKAAKRPPKLDPSLSFESALEQLETTVGRLEAGEMPLEEALELFENGVNLSRQCATTLEAAEKRIEILVADREDGRSETFDAEELDDEIQEEDD
jgi:exodeoxyribonuclease VII small subunit